MDRFTVYLVNGQKWECLLEPEILVLVWAKTMAKKMKVVVIPAWNESGVAADLSIHRIDPDRTFSGLVYDRTITASVPPPKAA